MASIGNIIILLGLIAFVNTTDLCGKTELCTEKFFPNDTDKICEMKYYQRNSESCHLMDFMTPQENKHSFNYPPWLTIHTYPKAVQTGFNLTILGGQWNHLKFRYQKNFHEEDTKDKLNYCREFNISPKVGRIPFIYDCDWTNYESETYILEVQVDSDDDGSRLGKYIFQMPQSDNIGIVDIEKLTIFIYIEITDLKTPIAHIQLADPRLKIERYIVTTYKIGKINETVSIRNVSATNATNNVFRFPINDVEGNFTIGVIPINSLGKKGTESFSSIVPRELPLSALILCVVTTGALLPSFIIGIFMWRYVRKQELERRNKMENEKYGELKKIHFEFPHEKKTVDDDLINYNLGDNMSPIEVEKRLMDTKGLVCS